MKKQIIIVITGIFIVVVVYFGYQIYRISALQTINVIKGEITASVFASGKTKAEKEAHLAFTSTGRIVYLPFKKNQEVKKGQVVATIDTSDLQANKEKELQDYLKTRWDYDQTKEDKDIKNTGGLSEDARRSAQRTLDKNWFDLNKSVRNVEISDRALKNASLYSPFDGIVTAVNGEINEWVSAFSTKPLVTIINPASVYFEAELEEENIEKIATGQAVIITLDAYSKKQYTATVYEIDRKTIDKDNGDTVLPVKLMFTAVDFFPTIGLNGDAQFILEKKNNVLIVPRRSLKKNNGNKVIMKKNGFGLLSIIVETGVADSKNIEIVNGVREGDQIVLPAELE